MACTCSSNGSQVEFSGSYMNGYLGIVDSWIGLSQICPRNPLDLIAYAKLGNTIGAFKNSSTYMNPSSGWLGDGCSVQSEPYCVALGSDNKQMEEDAKQWNFSHRTNSDNPNIALPLKKLIFLRTGIEWKMVIPSTFGQSAADVQLSFLNNAATRGDAQGTIPVIEFSASYDAGTTYDLEVTLNSFRQVAMGMRLNINGSQYAMYEMDWVGIK